jgi:hypothetical protein
MGLPIATPPSLRISGEGGLVDLEFGLVWHQLFTQQDAFVFFAAATHESALLAFNLYFPQVWKHQPTEGFPPDVFAYRSPMALARSILDGAAFARPLAALYGLPAPAREIAEFTDLEAVTLSGRPQRVLDEKLRLKVFLGEAELYLNIDFPSRLVQLREKSREWRAAILAALVDGTPAA